MGPSVFLPLLEDLDAETLELLSDFDLSGEGYTLILPANEARDFNSSQPEAKGPVFEVYDWDVNATTPAEITEVVRAHVVPGTLTFNSISAEVKAGGTYTVTSLQGYEWTFALASAGELVGAANASANATAGGTYPVLLDNHNITTRGFFNMEADIRKVAECPNAVIISTDGFFAAPQFLEPPAEAPVPAPAPAPAPVEPSPEPTAAEAPEPVSTDEEAGGAPPPDGADAGAAAGVAAGSLAASAMAGAAALALVIL